MCALQICVLLLLLRVHDYTHAVFFDEVNERSSLDLDWLSVPVIERQHEVKEVAFA